LYSCWMRVSRIRSNLETKERQSQFPADSIWVYQARMASCFLRSRLHRDVTFVRKLGWAP
jgi:hypothetical protein